eukprot:gene17036-biopygen9808
MHIAKWRSPDPPDPGGFLGNRPQERAPVFQCASAKAGRKSGTRPLLGDSRRIAAALAPAGRGDAAAAAGARTPSSTVGTPE